MQRERPTAENSDVLSRNFDLSALTTYMAVGESIHKQRQCSCYLYTSKQENDQTNILWLNCNFFFLTLLYWKSKYPYKCTCIMTSHKVKVTTDSLCSEEHRSILSTLPYQEPISAVKCIQGASNGTWWCGTAMYILTTADRLCPYLAYRYICNSCYKSCISVQLLHM